AESERVEVLDVEPYDERAGIIVSAGTDRFAERRKLEKSKQRRGDHERRRARVDFRRVDDQRSDQKAVERVGRLNTAGVRAEDDQKHVDDDDRDGDQQHELAVLGPRDERIDEAGLHHVTKYEEEVGERHGPY